jgi:ubiquinone/menaquinone biosynthesis C-methylase UbiE
MAPSLELIFETIHGFQRTGAIKAAVELDVFTAIAEGADTAAAIAKRAGTPERGMRILADYLVVIGLLKKAGTRYQLTEDTELFLNRKSSAYMGGTLDFFLSPAQADAYQDVAAAVRKDGTVAGAGSVEPEHPMWVTFARAMAPLMAMPAQLLAKLLTTNAEAKARVLDIAAGHGLYGIEFGKQNPNAEIVALDWSNVLQVAAENARAAALGNRFHTIAGSAFDVDFGGKYDMILLPNFLHHFGPDEITKFLKKCWAALADGGRLAILEFIPNEDRVTPRVPAEFAMMMLPNTPKGDAYTYSDYQRLLRDAGFPSSDLHDLPPTFFRVVVALK